MNDLQDEQLDALTEILNIGVGRAAAVLNEMTDAPVSLHVPIVKLTSADKLEESLGKASVDPVISVSLQFSGPFSGTAQLVFPAEAAAKLVTALTNDDEKDDEDLDEIRLGTLVEVGNIVINGVMGSVSNVFSERIDYQVPDYKEDSIINLLDHGHMNPGVMILLAGTQFSIEELQLAGEFILLFEVGSFDALIRAVNPLLKE